MTDSSVLFKTALRETSVQYILFPQRNILVKFGVTQLKLPGRKPVGIGPSYDLQYLSPWA